jgi:ABC-2 type transport system permease protein
MRTLRFLIRKELLQIRRDRAMLRLLILVPIVQLLILANAATFEVRSTSMYVVDLDRSSVSRGVIQRMTASELFAVKGASASLERANDALLKRDVSVILHILPDLERDLVRSGAAPVQLIFNAEDGAAAGIMASYATRVLSSYSAELDRELRPSSQNVRSRDATPETGASRIDVRTRGWYNPQLDYIDFIVPGLLALLVTIIATSIGSMNIVREKEIGTIEQLNVTPITKVQFIASKLLPFWFIALGVLGLGLTLGWLVFSIPMRGSLLLIFGAAAIYLLVALGIGLWVSTVVSTQQQAMFVSFAFNMIYLLMSGLFTPIQSMPNWAQWMAELSPLKHFIVIMRGVLVKGAGLTDVYVPLLVLSVYGVVVLLLAVRQYSKTTA